MQSSARKSFGIFFNAPYLGGAERSLLHQIKFVERNDRELIFYIPVLDSSKSYQNTHDLLRFKTEIQRIFPESKVVEFLYPQELFQFSRDSSKIQKLLTLFPSILETYLIFRKLQLHRHQVLWANGNKIGFILWFYWLLSGSKSCLIWHHRDYPAQSKVYKMAFKLLTVFKRKNFCHIANSYSVQESLRKILTNRLPLFVLYNPIGLPVAKHLSSSVKIHTIAHVGMLAPWKGQLEFIDFVTNNAPKLCALGIKEVKIFGESLYQTSGEHLAYKRQLDYKLEAWDQKPTIAIISGKNPSEIFSSIDTLFHTSKREEPFGRVLIEAFSQGKPVLSTALGGAMELIGRQEERGWKIDPEGKDWIQQLEEIITNSSTRNQKLAQALNFSEQLPSLIRDQLGRIYQKLNID